MLPAVLRIGANLGRIRVRGSVPLTNGSGILLFSSVIFKARSFCAYYFLKVHLHNFSKIKSHKEVTKQRVLPLPMPGGTHKLAGR